MTLPLLGITMGDPAGIGPEIILQALRHDAVRQRGRPLAIGQAAAFRRVAGSVGFEGAIRAVRHPAEARFEPGTLDVLEASPERTPLCTLGEVSAAGGQAAFDALRVAIAEAMAGRIDAVVTCPLHKEALQRAGHHFPGHTEIFAHFTNTPDVTMMLAEGNLRVVHVSTHIALRAACDAVTRERVGKVIELARDACRRLGIPEPRIGVAGLNPHAGDGGLFGFEERDAIIPAIEAARARGWQVSGPVPPDTFYAKAAGGAYDICVAMYHDQGHIPVKLLGFQYDAAKDAWTNVSGINVTLGLPIIRVSVDHGTAFDQAGKGTASEASLLNAIEYAARMARAA